MGIYTARDPGSMFIRVYDGNGKEITQCVYVDTVKQFVRRIKDPVQRGRHGALRCEELTIDGVYVVDKGDNP